jgi:hypothetical protein
LIIGLSIDVPVDVARNIDDGFDASFYVRFKIWLGKRLGEE